MTDSGQWLPGTSISIGVNGNGYPVCCVKKGADTRTYGRFYVAVVQSVLILGSDLWVVTPNIMRLLGSLCNWVAQQITGRMPRCWNGCWWYPPIGEAIAEARLEPIGEYISRCHISVPQYITTRSIFDLVVAEERQTISLATMQWWEQEIIQFRN